MSLDTSWNLQAITALDVSAMAASENIANSSTDNFRPVRAELEDGLGGKGVQVADVVELTGTTNTAADGPGFPLVPQGRSTDYEGGVLRPLITGENNSVDIAREMVDLMQIDRAYSANIAVIGAVEQTTGHVLDMMG
jgi:flagellar basal body rod protein FlgB